MGDLIRGKPTLTREILTPKLNSIIGYYFQYLHFAPLLILNSLQTLLKFHPTTFRPFGNKLKTKLINLIVMVVVVKNLQIILKIYNYQFIIH